MAFLILFLCLVHVYLHLDFACTTQRPPCMYSSNIILVSVSNHVHMNTHYATQRSTRLERSLLCYVKNLQFKKVFVTKVGIDPLIRRMHLRSLGVF